ncbi:hypothetical protein KJ682_05950 [bacterium]|nr:hypothetical protein [bacterium]
MPKTGFPRLTPALCLVAVLAASSAPAADRPVITHEVTAEFDVVNHTVRIIDELMVPGGLDHLRLGRGFNVEAMWRVDHQMLDPIVVIREAEDEDGPYQELATQPMGLSRSGGYLKLVYSGRFFESVEDVVFSRENVGGEITATIGDEGIYLSAGSGWLAGSPDCLAVFDLTFDTPAGFETVTQGARILHAEKGGRLTTRWTTTHPSDGASLIANRFVVHEDPIRDDLVSYTFFLEDDAPLRETYFERTRTYIAMYEEMIGPYPYAKFATVENWFPTGYGMPSWTLLGSQVLRLPFIPYTSFGHEIAHNWWGNSVFVDTDQGNWCEGLTVWCADYHYKELESPEAALDYRRNVLKDYAGYVQDPAKDFPLSEFKSRHSGATRAVGYGKSMMVFHMVDRLIGREAFLAALRQVAADHQYRPAAWSDFVAAFGARGGVDLGAFADQWLRRTGAPELALADVEFGGDEVSFRLIQAGDVYDLQVPVVVSGDAGEQEHVLPLTEASATFTLPVAGVRQLAVDPGCDLFRRLHPEEIEPTLRQVLGADEVVFSSGAADPDLVAAGRRFAEVFAERAEVPFETGGAIPASGDAAVVVNPAGDVLKSLLPADLVVAGQTVVLGGKRYSLKEFDLVFAAADPGRPGRTVLVVLCGAPARLEGLAGRLGHYGKYSWLVLPAGQGRVERGNWSVGDSPLLARR